MSLSSGSYMVPQAVLVGLTGDRYCCVSFALVTIAIFWSMNLKDIKVDSGCSLSQECSPFAW